MAKYIPRKKTTYPFQSTTYNGESVSFDNNLKDAKKEAVAYTNKTGRVVEIFKYIGRVERT